MERIKTGEVLEIIQKERLAVLINFYTKGGPYDEQILRQIDITVQTFFQDRVVFVVAPALPLAIAFPPNAEDKDDRKALGLWRDGQRVDFRRYGEMTNDLEVWLSEKLK